MGTFPNCTSAAGFVMSALLLLLGLPLVAFGGLMGDQSAPQSDAGAADDTSDADETERSAVAVTAANGADDLLRGTEFANNLFGQAGDDTLIGNGGADWLQGGDGVDRLFGGTGADTALGGAGNDLLLGEEGGDSLLGNGEDDRLFGGLGEDLLDGGSGDDGVFGGEQEDTLLGGTGADTLNGGAAADSIFGGDGADLVILFSDNGADRIFLDEGNDRLAAANATDALFARGGGGADQMAGGAGADTIHGDTGDDTLWGNGANDVIYAGTGDDAAFGGDGADGLFGGSGNDSLSGDAGNDRLDGGEGDDVLESGSGADLLLGGDGADSINAQSPDNQSDTVLGGAGNDIVRADGTDRVTLGTGADVVTLVNASGVVVTDFDPVQDRLELLYTGTRPPVLDVATEGTVAVVRLDGAVVARLEGAGGLAAERIVLQRDPADQGVRLTAENDFETVQNANQDVYGLAGDDRLSSLLGWDALYGGLGNDQLTSVDPSQVDSPDTLFGGLGDDTLAGDDGDILTGGAGVDDFSATTAGRATMTIVDFDPAQESLRIEVEPFVNGSQNVADYPVQVAQAAGGGTDVLVAGRVVVSLPGVPFGVAVRPFVTILSAAV